MYDLYIMYLSVNIQNLQTKIENQRILVDKHLTNISEIKIHIESYIDFNALINGKINSIPIEFKNAVGNYNYYNIIIKNYYTLFNILLQYENECKSLEDQKVSYNVYKNVITKYNKKMLKYCIDTGKAFSNKYFGTLQLFYREADGVKRKVNWKLSNENKKAILERGGEPYLEKNAKAAEEAGVEYKGEKWIVLGFEQGLLYWRWYPSPLIKDEIKREVYNYKFIPARGDFGAIKMLSDIYKKESHNYKIYAV